MRRYKNLKPQNRLRVVFWEKNGKPTSYLHIENSESEKFLAILKEIQKHDDWVLAGRLCKKMKIPRVTFTWAITRMTGARYVEQKKNGVYRRLLTGPLILIRKEMMHANVRRGLEKPYMNPPIYIRKAGPS